MATAATRATAGSDRVVRPDLTFGWVLQLLGIGASRLD